MSLPPPSRSPPAGGGAAACCPRACAWTSDWHGEAGVLTDAVRQRRRDAIFRLFLTPRTDGLGPRFQLTFATATAERDTAVTKHSLSQGIVEIGNTWRRAHAELTVRLGDEPRPWEVEGRVAWIPLRRENPGAGGHHTPHPGGGPPRALQPPPRREPPLCLPPPR